MHELSVSQNIIEIAEKWSGSATVLLIKVEVGKLSSISPEALSFCFDACKEGTRLEKAELRIEVIEAMGICQSCKLELTLKEPPWQCACGSKQVRCISGFDLTVKELEVKECA